MIIMRSIVLTTAALLGIAAAAPLGAQTSATLNVSARVIEECTITARTKRELVKIARRLNDPSLLRRCSVGVVSRVDRRVVKMTKLRPPAPAPSHRSRKQVVRKGSGEQTEVVLLTVTY